MFKLFVRAAVEEALKKTKEGIHKFSDGRQEVRVN